LNNEPEKAKDNLIARDPVFFQKSMFRAFLHYNTEDLENMSIDEYMKCSIILKEYLKILHAPYMDHNNT